MIGPDFAVEIVPISDVHPSPENDDIYGALVHDEQMTALIRSITTRGLEEPIIVTADNFIISGHRRYYACECLEMEHIPVRIKPDVTRANNDDFHRLLTEYNPQRVKTVSAILKESLLRYSDQAPGELLYRHDMAMTNVAAEFTVVHGAKHVQVISDRRMDFLEAARYVIRDLRDFWPLSIRQIHYRLLNKPPLMQSPKTSKYPAEHYRYKNDLASYKALSRLLTSARYHGQVDIDVIDDVSRPRFPFDHSFRNVQEFVDQQMREFMTGYHRSPQF
ncbi:MAG: ParB/RepB/Spo0J family partition protein, partial [Planctomycetaceae bacterium]